MAIEEGLKNLGTAGYNINSCTINNENFLKRIGDHFVRTGNMDSKTPKFMEKVHKGNSHIKKDSENIMDKCHKASNDIKKGKIGELVSVSKELVETMEKIEKDFNEYKENVKEFWDYLVNRNKLGPDINPFTLNINHNCQEIENELGTALKIAKDLYEEANFLKDNPTY